MMVVPKDRCINRQIDKECSWQST